MVVVVVVFGNTNFPALHATVNFSLRRKKIETFIYCSSRIINERVILDLKR